MPDIFDRVKLDPFEEMPGFVKEEVEKAISNIPMGKLISEAMGAISRSQDNSIASIRAKISAELKKEMAEIEKKTAAFKIEMEEFMEKMRQKYADLRNEISQQPQYQFGGYPPPGGFLPIQNAGIDQWRFIIVGDNLSVQKFESGAWVEKGVFLP